MVKTFCVIFCACQCQFERKFWNFELLWFFCEILSRLRKNVEVMLAFRVLLEGHFGAPKNCKSWALVRTRAQFWQFSLTFFLQICLCKDYKKTWKLSSRSNESSTFADPFHLKKRSMHLYKVSPFCDFCETPLVYGGGYVWPETLRTAPQPQL